LKTTIRNTLPDDFQSIIDLTRRIYPESAPWRVDQLESHLNVFPEGQFVAVDRSGKVVGMAASLIVRWDDYNFDDDWRDFTDSGMFTNHDPDFGRTLYGAEVMVDPSLQRSGIGGGLYAARRSLAERLNIPRIRAAARLRGYHRYAHTLTPREYVYRVMAGQLKDPTLSFQLKHGFEVIGVVRNYLHHDQESAGHAALIEWRNPESRAEGDAAALGDYGKLRRLSEANWMLHPTPRSTTKGDSRPNASLYG
jgi:ribosomal protein S18 acetylase RimI-like enzyme